MPPQRTSSGEEIRRDDPSRDDVDVEDTVFVAVGKTAAESMSVLSWAKQSFPGKRMCLLHVRRPSQLAAAAEDGKSLASKLRFKAAKAIQDHERRKMHKLLNQYVLFLSQEGLQVDMVWTEMDCIEEGIVEIIVKHNVRWLVMGAAADRYYSMTMEKLRSKKAIFVCQKAPMTCQIWFACQGRLIYTRRATKSETHVHCAHPLPLLDSDTKTEELNNTRVDSVALKQSSFTEHVPEAGPIDGNSHLGVSQSHVKAEAGADTEKGVSGKLYSQSTEEILDRSTLSVSLTVEAKASERAEQDAEKMKNQYDALMQELQMVQGQSSLLENQLAKCQSEVKDLEDKMASAAKLQMTMKDRQDKLRTGSRGAAKAVETLKSLAKMKAKSLLGPQFLVFSSQEITEATQNFDLSQKIDEETYRGFLLQMEFSIKKLPLNAFPSELDFQHKVELVSRVRHPNLLTLVGTCPESRSLVYEYLKNGKLETRLACKGNTLPLSWQTRIQIASDICSALIFLHSNKPCLVHGYVKPSKVLLDTNFVGKLAYLGFTDRPRSNSRYTDPEYLETGELTPKSDVYSFGIIMLRLLTARPVVGIIKDVKCALEKGTFNAVVDSSAGDWPLEHATRLAHLALRCCEKCRFNRPDLASEVLSVLELKTSSTASVSRSARKKNRPIPPYFVCPIVRDIMEDPVIATDGFTYEAEAIEGWFNSGHDTSPMTNLKLEDCSLLPNHALHYAIQEWLQQ